MHQVQSEILQSVDVEDIESALRGCLLKLQYANASLGPCKEGKPCTVSSPSVPSPHNKSSHIAGMGAWPTPLYGAHTRLSCVTVREQMKHSLLCGSGLCMPLMQLSTIVRATIDLLCLAVHAFAAAFVSHAGHHQP